MAPKKTNARSLRRDHIVQCLAVLACAAISGAAITLSLGTLVDRWFVLSISQDALAIAGGLAGAGAALLLYALLSPSIAGDGALFANALVWTGFDSSLMTPMAWTPVMITLPHTSPMVDARSLTLRRRNVAARRCAVRRRGLRPNARRRVCSTRALPPLEPYRRRS